LINVPILISKGEIFKPHFDGEFSRNNSDTSFFTFIIYLNDGFDGGHTTFFKNDDAKQPIRVVPKRGTALLFYHGIIKFILLIL
jgi:hypothetical protein